MTTSISSEAFEEAKKKKDKTVKKLKVDERTKWVFEQIFSDHKKKSGQKEIW